MTWVTVIDTPETKIENLNGVWWNETPKPFRLHRCKAQTRGWLGIEYMERCRCGAFGPAPFVMIGRDNRRVRP